MAVEHEPNALLPGAELHGARDGEAAPHPSRRANRVSQAARNGAHGIEGRMPFARGSALSCGDMVPAFMSVLSASFIMALAALARVTPPPWCVPSMRPNRT